MEWQQAGLSIFADTVGERLLWPECEILPISNYVPE
jgi:hypothetical protein